MADTNTTISQMCRGFRAPYGPRGSSGTSGSTTPVMTANCRADRRSSMEMRAAMRCTGTFAPRITAVVTVRMTAGIHSPNQVSIPATNTAIAAASVVVPGSPSTGAAVR